MKVKRLCFLELFSASLISVRNLTLSLYQGSGVAWLAFIIFGVRSLAISAI